MYLPVAHRRRKCKRRNAYSQQHIVHLQHLKIRTVQQAIYIDMWAKKDLVPRLYHTIDFNWCCWISIHCCSSYNARFDLINASALSTIMYLLRGSRIFEQNFEGKSERRDLSKRDHVVLEDICFFLDFTGIICLSQVWQLSFLQ